MISRKGMDVMELEMNVGKRIERGKNVMMEKLLQPQKGTRNSWLGRCCDALYV